MNFYKVKWLKDSSLNSLIKFLINFRGEFVNQILLRLQFLVLFKICKVGFVYHIR